MLDAEIDLLQALIRKYMPIAVIVGTVLLVWILKRTLYG